VPRRVPRVVSHSLTAPSLAAEATSLPFGENIILWTDLKRPTNVRRASPVAESQSLTVPSSDADAISLLFGEIATAVTESESLSRALRLVPAARVPEPDSVVGSCRRDQLAVRREYDRKNLLRMALQNATKSFSRRTPEPYCSIIGDRYDQLTIWRECNGIATI